MVLPVRISEALIPTRAVAAAIMPVVHAAVEPKIQAQASTVNTATGEPGMMGKMVPKMATNIRTAAITVTGISTLAVDWLLHHGRRGYDAMVVSAQIIWFALLVCWVPYSPLELSLAAVSASSTPESVTSRSELGS